MLLGIIKKKKKEFAGTIAPVTLFFLLDDHLRILKRLFT